LRSLETAPGPHFERGFTPYLIDAKCEMPDMPRAGAERYGVVNSEVAAAMVAGRWRGAGPISRFR
jgi:nicotinamide mononucleotide (NMN) deamidase PncC